MAAPRWRAGTVRRRSGCRRCRVRPLSRGRRRRVARGHLRPSARGRLGRGRPPAGCRAGTRHRSRQRLFPSRPRARRRQWHLRHGRTGRGRNVSPPAARWGAAGGTRHRRAVGFYRAPDGVGIDPGTAPDADGPSPFPRGARGGGASDRARRLRGVRPEDAPLSGGSGSLRRGPQAGTPRKVDRGPAGEPPGHDAGQGAGDRGPGCGGSRRTPTGFAGPHCLRQRCLFGLPLDRGTRAHGHGADHAGAYRLPAYAYSTMAVATHKAPVGAYRGVGMTVGVFVMERLVDKVAATTGIDPAEVRRRNFIRPEEFPYAASTGLVYDSGRVGDTLAAGLAAVDYEETRHEQARLRAARRIVGVGLSSLVGYTGMGSETVLRRGMREVHGHDNAT